MQLALQAKRRLIVHPLGEPVICRQDEFVREADAVGKTATHILDQILETFDRIGPMGDEACRAQSFPGTTRFQLIQ